MAYDRKLHQLYIVNIFYCKTAGCINNGIKLTKDNASIETYPNITHFDEAISNGYVVICNCCLQHGKQTMKVMNNHKI